MSVTIGIAGQIGAGKGTFIKIFSEIVRGSVDHFRTSGFLGETLTSWAIPHTRENFQNLAIIMDRQYGDGTLTRALAERMRLSAADYLIYDCMRQQSDLALIRSFPRNLTVYIGADIRLRWQRKRDCSEKAGEQGLTFEEFQAADNHAIESGIAQLRPTADFHIWNEESLGKFRSDIEMFVTMYARPLLQRP